MGIEQAIPAEEKEFIEVSKRRKRSPSQIDDGPDGL